MNQKKIIIVFLSCIVGQVFAQYQIKRYTINSGGGKTSGGGYSIHSSIGQVDASSTFSGGTYTLNGGFWHENRGPISDTIFIDGFE